MSEPDPRIRAVALGLAVRDGHLLVEAYAARPGHPAFVRGVGGGIEYGERGAAAVLREFREELAVDVTVGARLGVLENLFRWEGRLAHEIVQVFAVTSPDFDGWPLGQERPIRDSDQGTTARWVALSDLARDHPICYPPGIVDLARLLDDSPPQITTVT